MMPEDPSFQGSDRRRFKRARVSLTVVYRVNEPLSARMLTSDKEVQATVVDLSEGGMAAITNYPITSGTVLLIRFTLFKVDKDDVSFYGPVEITGEVRYNILLDKDQYRLGIEFIKIDDQDRREIASFVNTAMNISNNPPKGKGA
ncbi:MAG: PilZ domain-containing protein [Candidatus Omnitrophica bacterium]|nr:PilZ domain-containing protein [Candidatus Omnitrophota bacterium]